MNILEKISTIFRKLLVALLSFFVYLPVFGGLFGAMILGAGLLRVSIYRFWELLLEIMSFIPQHPFKDVTYFVGYVTLPSYIDFVVIGSGFIFLLIGIVVFLLSVYTLVRGIVKNQPVVTGGFYQYIRHPQNLGLITIALGFMLLMPLNPSWPINPDLKYSLRIGDIYSWLLFALFWLVEAKWEEERLVSHLGSPFQAYIDKVPFIIPAGAKIENILSRFVNPSWKIRYRILLWISFYLLIVILSSFFLFEFKILKMTH